MNSEQIKYELQNLLSGKSHPSHCPIIEAVAGELGTGQRTGPMAQEKHQNKAQETAKLLKFAQQRGLLVDEIDETRYISEGAEQKVYIKNEEHVFKLNDAIYYASWEDYFHNLLLHNYFFPDTAYNLLGFYQVGQTLFAVVKQPFVRASHITDLSAVHAFLTSNGFTNTKNHDFYPPV